MRAHKVGALPVVQGDQVVGIITEQDFFRIAGHLLDENLPEEYPRPRHRGGLPLRNTDDAAGDNRLGNRAACPDLQVALAGKRGRAVRQ